MKITVENSSEPSIFKCGPIRVMVFSENGYVQGSQYGFLNYGKSSNLQKIIKAAINKYCEMNGLKIEIIKHAIYNIYRAKIKE